MFINALSGSRFSSRDTEEWLDEYFVVQPVKALCIIPPVPSRRPGALLAIDVTSVRLPSHSHAAIRMPAIATTPEVISAS